MSSNLRVNSIVPATGTNVAIGTAGGTITYGASVSGVSTFTTINATSIVGVTTAGITTAYIGSVNDGPISGVRNKIINGDCRIDQRNAGVSTTIPAAAVTYTLDRWAVYTQQASKVSVQRSGTAPVGFTSSLLVTSLAATTAGAGEGFALFQKIEGFNWSDLNFGTNDAKTVTLSFWSRSSLTGTFSGVIKNEPETHSYPFTYTISSSNTWEYKTIIIQGSTAGTWATNTATGALLAFDLGSGSNLKGTSGSWNASALNGVTGSVNLIGTNGATLHITGVQLEAGTVATPFERRSFGQELALCQRYYQKSYNANTAVPTSTFEGIEWINGANARISNTTRFVVQMRTPPSVRVYDSVSAIDRVRTSGGDGQTGFTIRGPSTNNFTADYTSGGVTEILYHWRADAEL